MAVEQEMVEIKLYQEVAIALIEASPEHLNHVSLRMEERGESVSVIIEVSDDPRDFFSPTDELLLAVNELGDYLRKMGKMCQAAEFVVSLSDEGKWSYNVEFENGI